MKVMSGRWVGPWAAVAAYSILACVAPASVASAADDPDLSGEWVIDSEASDEPHEVLDSAMRRRSGGLGRVSAGVSIFGIPVGDVVEAATGESGSASSRRSEEHREDLHRHVTDAIDALSIVQTPDAVRVDYDGIGTYLYRNGTEMSDRDATLHADWHRGVYVVDREYPDRAKVTEEFRLDRRDPGRLYRTVMTELESGKNITIRRVYDRSPPP